METCFNISLVYLISVLYISIICNKQFKIMVDLKSFSIFNDNFFILKIIKILVEF